MPDNLTLLKRVAEGDNTALEEVIESNMGLVRSIAQRFIGRGCEYEDLIQIGSIGLLRAARSFDFSRECMFSTYAVPLIIGEIKRFLRDDGLIKVSRSVKSAGVNIMKQKELFIRKNGREPSISEISELTSLTPEEIVHSLEATGPVASLSESVGDDDLPLEYFIADKSDSLEGLTDRIALFEAIKKLTPRRQKIVYLRFFKDYSQQETGAALGITQVKVSREEKIILEELRHAL